MTTRPAQGETGGLRYQVGPGRSHAWQMCSEDGETWQRCTHGCGVQIQSFDEFKTAAGLAKGATKAQEWRIKVGGQVYWSDTVPRCGRGTWKDPQLAAGDIADQLEAGE